MNVTDFGWAAVISFANDPAQAAGRRTGSLDCSTKTRCRQVIEVKYNHLSLYTMNKWWRFNPSARSTAALGNHLEVDQSGRVRCWDASLSRRPVYTWSANLLPLSRGLLRSLGAVDPRTRFQISSERRLVGYLPFSTPRWTVGFRWPAALNVLTFRGRDTLCNDLNCSRTQSFNVSDCTNVPHL